MTLGALAGDHIYTLYTHKVGCTIASGPEAEMVHEKQVKLEGHKKGKRKENEVGNGGSGTLDRGAELGKRLIYPDRLIPGQTAPQTAYCHQEVMQYLESSQ